MASIVPRLLVIEAEPAFLHILQSTLEFGGFSSEVARTAIDSLHRLKTEKYDAVLLNLDLPDLGGVHVVKAIRQEVDLPLLVVSACTGESQKIEVLDLGADDFIEKPFYPGELLARIRAAIRGRAGHPAATSPLPRVSPRPWPERTKATKLTPLETRLLDSLMAHIGEAVSNEELTHAVWGRKQREAGHLRVLVTQLRRKLEQRGEPIEITNERGRGYRVTPAHAPNELPRALRRST